MIQQYKNGHVEQYANGFVAPFLFFINVLLKQEHCFSYSNVFFFQSLCTDQAEHKIFVVIEFIHFRSVRPLAKTVACVYIV